MKKEAMKIQVNNAVIETELVKGDTNFALGRDSHGNQDHYDSGSGGLGHDRQGGDYIGNQARGYKGFYAKFDEEMNKNLKSGLPENSSISSILNKMNRL